MVISKKKAVNKAFKSDSQGLAFFIQSLSSVFTVVWFRGFVVHTLMWCYASFQLTGILG